MSRDLLVPLLKEFIDRYPDLRIEIEPYVSNWDQELADDVDVLFKLRPPKDSLRRFRVYPGTIRGLFASRGYVNGSGSPATPHDLAAHVCIGAGVWKLSRGKETVTPNIDFRVISGDPAIALKLATSGFGIAVLPLWMAKAPKVRKGLVPILSRWTPEPVNLWALFSGSSRLTPKVQVFLDFLDEYIGTNRDPRLKHDVAKGYFTDRTPRPT